MPWSLVAGWLAVPVLFILFPVVPGGGGISTTTSLTHLLRGAGKLSPLPAFMLVVVCVATGYLLGQRFPSGQVARHKTWPSAFPQYGVLAGILLVGASIRFYGLDFGLPAAYHPDEARKAWDVLAMEARGDLEPLLFYHPSLLLYLTYFMKGILGPLDMAGSSTALALIAGRSVSAVAGTISILLVYVIGRELRLGGWSLIAAAVFAVSPLPVTCSRYLKEDALLIFMSLLAISFLIPAFRSRSGSWLMLGGLLTGLACSSKYTGLLLLFPILAWPWVVSRKVRPSPYLFKATLAALGLVAAGFFIGSPYALIRSEAVARGFIFELRHAAAGYHSTQQGVGFVISPWSQLWMYHLGRGVIPGMTLLTSVGAFIGLGILVKKRSLEGAVVIFLALLFLLPSEMANSKPHPQPERYILGVIPPLCIAAAALVRGLWTCGWKKWGFVIALILIGSPLARSLHLAQDLDNDTRTRFVAWALENLPHKTRIYLDFSKSYSGSLPGGRFRKKDGSVFRWKEQERLDYLVESSFGSGRFFEQPNPYDAIQNDLLELRAKSRLVKEFRSGSGAYGFHNPHLRLYRLPPE